MLVYSPPVSNFICPLTFDPALTIFLTIPYFPPVLHGQEAPLLAHAHGWIRGFFFGGAFALTVNEGHGTNSFGTETSTLAAVFTRVLNQPRPLPAPLRADFFCKKMILFCTRTTITTPPGLLCPSSGPKWTKTADWGGGALEKGGSQVTIFF